MSAQRREQALKFRHENGRRLSLAVYLLLMDGLREEYGIQIPPEFDYTAEGKPFILGRPDIHFSFSHSGNVALCALSDQPVGADVEVPRKITPSLVSYTMNDREHEQINASADPALRFLYFWTRKEALLKLTGEGIRNDMKQVLSESGKCHFETVKTNNYLFSVVKYREQFNDSPKP
ncbi:MAG: 4'-phosphopantetheinyl transferase superfamily protein [Fibrobacter sp.]|nr:4'-phosphopantetheinyl transferase superfamily protein [Fibrobacter sp.]